MKWKQLDESTSFVALSKSNSSNKLVNVNQTDVNWWDMQNVIEQTISLTKSWNKNQYIRKNSTQKWTHRNGKKIRGTEQIKYTEWNEVKQVTGVGRSQVC